MQNGANLYRKGHQGLAQRRLLLPPLLSSLDTEGPVPMAYHFSSYALAASAAAAVDIAATCSNMGHVCPAALRDRRCNTGYTFETNDADLLPLHSLPRLPSSAPV
jgi:hypothetical protein